MLTEAQREDLASNLKQYEQFARRRIARLNLYSFEDREDLLAAINIRAVSNFQGYNPSLGAFGTWFGFIVKREIKDFILKRSALKRNEGLKERSLNEADLEANPQTCPGFAEVDYSLLIKHAKEILKGIVAPRTFQAFWLYRVEDKDITEIATLMNLRPRIVIKYVSDAQSVVRAHSAQILAHLGLS